MQSKILQSGIFIVVMFSSMNVLAEPYNHTNQKSSGPADVVAYAALGGIKIASAAVAIPLLTVGEIGNVSGAAGNALWENANKPIGESLEVTNHVTGMHSLGELVRSNAEQQ